MNCTALAPEPTTAMVLPAGSNEWSHSAEWNDVPANESTPSIAGSLGRESWPTALTRMSTVSSRS